MPIEGQNTKIRRGDHKELIFTIDLVSMETEDLSNADVFWYMDTKFRTGETFEVDDAIVSKTENDATIVGNVITIDLFTTDTAPLKKQRYFHELRIRDDMGNISTTTRGRIIIF